MASFATSDDLAARLKKTFTNADKDQADSLLAGATAKIRALTGQWISQVVDDVWTTDAPVSRVVWLPQRPVTAVASVTVDGVAVTDWVLRGSRLRRKCLWATACEESELVVTYSHGYADDDEELVLAKDAAMAMAGWARGNIGGLKQRTIDDFTQVFGDESQWEYLYKALIKQYGKRPATGSVNTSVTGYVGI